MTELVCCMWSSTRIRPSTRPCLGFCCSTCGSIFVSGEVSDSWTKGTDTCSIWIMHRRIVVTRWKEFLKLWNGGISRTPLLPRPLPLRLLLVSTAQEEVVGERVRQCAVVRTGHQKGARKYHSTTMEELFPGLDQKIPEMPSLQWGILWRNEASTNLTVPDVENNVLCMPVLNSDHNTDCWLSILLVCWHSCAISKLTHPTWPSTRRRTETW